MQWDAPWGKGYPGWHIECSAMAMQYLGETIDIHTGGEDNKFPHHECEIAQSEGASGKPFSNYWLHVTHLVVEGEKMSKSKGNFYTLSDLLDKGHDAREVRYLLLSTNYRQTLNFTMDGLGAAKAALERLDEFVDLLGKRRSSTWLSTVMSFWKPGVSSTLVVGARKKFEGALDDDLNVSEALAAVFDLVRDINEKNAKGTLDEGEHDGVLRFMEDVGAVLGFEFGRRIAEADIPKEILQMVEARDEARDKKDFAEADRLRDELKEKGFEVEDTPDGRKIKRV